VLRRFSRGDEGGQHALAALSDREFEVFELLGRGESAAEIAETLDLSPKTIHTYRQRILEKLDLDSSRELLRYAISWMEDGA
jgi:DNA-binding NarL/FixJ family response regulator